MKNSEMHKTGYLVVLFMSHLNDCQIILQGKKSNKLFMNN
jgi:hypothetical protein